MRCLRNTMLYNMLFLFVKSNERKREKLRACLLIDAVGMWELFTQLCGSYHPEPLAMARLEFVGIFQCKYEEFCLQISWGCKYPWIGTAQARDVLCNRNK